MFFMKSFFCLRILSMLMIFILIVSRSNSQSIDQIIDKHVLAMGGKEKLDSLKTLLIEGSFRLEQYELPLKAYLSHNEGQRFDVSVLKTHGFIIITPASGWQYFPFQGMKDPQPLKGTEQAMYLPTMDLQGPLFNYQQKGNNISLEGLEKIEENPCYKMHVVLKSGQEMNVYLDTVTYYIIKTTIKNTLDAGGSMFENLYGNFQKTPEGFIIPNAMTLGPGKMFIRKLLVNSPIAPSKFDPVNAQKEITQ